MAVQISVKNSHVINPIINPIIYGLTGNLFSPSAAKTTNYTGKKICMYIVLTMRSDQKPFSQPFHEYNFTIKEMQLTGFMLVLY